MKPIDQISIQFDFLSFQFTFFSHPQILNARTASSNGATSLATIGVCAQMEPVPLDAVHKRNSVPVLTLLLAPPCPDVPFGRVSKQHRAPNSSMQPKPRPSLASKLWTNPFTKCHDTSVHLLSPWLLCSSCCAFWLLSIYIITMVNESNNCCIGININIITRHRFGRQYRRHHLCRQ